jgi:hypothetical protein
MATKKQPAAPRSKPLLSIAAFFTRVLEAVDGHMSGIKAIDSLIATVPSNRNPEARIPISLWALIAFKRGESGDLIGEHVLRLVMRSPTGKKSGRFEYPLKFESSVPGFNVRLRISLNIKTEGTHWMDVILDGRKYTSMPLHVRFESAREGTSG